MSDAVDRLFNWLSEDALPLWSTTCVDRERGGFIEQLNSDGTIIADVRRARLVARQIYAFQTAARLGWSGPGEELARHGVEALLAHHLGDDDVAIPRYHTATGEHEASFDLYDQAFLLFGLSYAARLPGITDCEERALRVVERMRADWQHDLGGFDEPSPGLKANPHMHLFEAAQAWLEVSSNPVWQALAAEMAGLCLQRFIDPETGALHEFFDGNWQFDREPATDMVEPGHQSEWAWLLMRWSLRGTDRATRDAADRLLSVAEDHGVHDRHGRLINELDASLAPRDRRMRLWPQTERIKSLILAAELCDDDSRQALLEERTGDATAKLLDYFDHPISGSWWEHIGDDDRPLDEPARASSLYHIMGAVSELARHYGRRLG